MTTTNGRHHVGGTSAPIGKFPARHLVASMWAELWTAYSRLS